MRYRLQTLNKGKIDAGYLDNAMKKVRVGDLIIPTDKFLIFGGKLIRNKNSQVFLSTEEGEITGIFEHNERNGTKRMRFGDYEINGGDFGYLIDKLIHEGSFKEMRRI